MPGCCVLLVEVMLTNEMYLLRGTILSNAVSVVGSDSLLLQVVLVVYPLLLQDL